MARGNDDRKRRTRRDAPGRPARPTRPTRGRRPRDDARGETREGGFGPHGKPAERSGREDRDRQSGRQDDRRRTSGRDARPSRDDGRGSRQPRRDDQRSDDDAPPKRSARPALRLKGERKAAGKASTRRTTKTNRSPSRRRRRPPADVETEILRLGGERGPRLVEQLMAAADAFGHDRDREAVKLLRPLRDALPDASSVRELMGLAHYRIGNYAAAAKELDAFVNLTNSVEQHPVLMDSLRAQRRWRRVDELWEELAATSPSAELVTEGRIVAAGALADRGRLDEAIALLERKTGDVKRAKPHHLRLWYALADLEERAGNLASARTLFLRVKKHDADFTDVTKRARALA
jgi:hypothetical protein